MPTTPQLPAHLASIRRDGSRLAIHPSDVHGRFITWRRVTFALLILIYAAAPLITLGGHPLVHLDVEHRRFFLFGQTYNAQDFWMVILLVLTFVFGVLAVTTWRGRVWCGWACPQTVFLEFLFRPIERFFDGPRERRIKRQTAPRTVGFVAKAALKHLCYLVVAWLVAHIALSLFLSTHELLSIIHEGPWQHPVAAAWAFAVTGVLYFNFAWFREQFCVVLCPYGRLQSVLHDRDSVIIGYDAQRGEPRGPLLKAGIVGPPRGDCVDCNKCVTACPTAIDIRHGLQLECVACAQCVDACDEVMTKIHKPVGLIRYASMNALEGKPTRTIRPRLLIYTLLFSVGAIAVTTALLSRRPFEANVLRIPGAPYFLEGTEVRNGLQIHLVNKSPEEVTYAISLTAPVTNRIAMDSPTVTVGSLEQKPVSLFVWVPRAELQRPSLATVTVKDLTHHEERVVQVLLLGPTTQPVK